MRLWLVSSALGYVFVPLSVAQFECKHEGLAGFFSPLS